MILRTAPVIWVVVRARQPPIGCSEPSYQRTRFASDQLLACCSSVPFLTTPGGGAMLSSGTVFTSLYHVAELLCSIPYLLCPTARVEFDAGPVVVAGLHGSQRFFET